MIQQTEFSSRDVPLARCLSGYHGLTTLFACGIVNPFGPTLNLLALEGELESRDRQPLLHIMLHPFEQSATEVGSACIKGTWIPERDLKPFFSLNLGSCPTLLVPGLAYPEDQAIDLFAALLPSFDDGTETLAKVRQFPSDPWRRVQDDVDRGLVHLEDATTRTQRPVPSRLTVQESRELAQHLLEPVNLSQELKAFTMAWYGAIQFQTEHGSVDLAESALGGPRFAMAMAMILASCRVQGSAGD